MASNYTEEKLNSLDKETIIQLFLSQQNQLERLDHTLQLMLEQLADLKRHRFGRSTERHEIEGQILFMETDGKIVFFNEAEAVAAIQEDPEAEEKEDDACPGGKPKRKKGNGKKTWKAFLLLWSSTPLKKATWRRVLEKTAGKSCRMKYTADILLPRQKSRWRNTM